MGVNHYFRENTQQIMMPDINVGMNTKSTEAVFKYAIQNLFRQGMYHSIPLYLLECTGQSMNIGYILSLPSNEIDDVYYTTLRLLMVDNLHNLEMIKSQMTEVLHHL